MKKLKKILLINWLYFRKELIEVGDINFLTGKNGAGKSTVIDALQIVLLGETNSRNFNQAANEKSQRTLESYLRADMDDNSPYSRRGKDFSTYIVCEFQDEMEGSSFVTGVTFDCRSDGSYRDTFFIYTGTLPENCFIEQGEAMEISALRRFLKQNYARAEFYDTQKEYRRNMLAKWNVHNEQVLRMMKKAVSFRPIVDIQKFITENICDIPDKPNIELMQQNIRDYKRHELLAQRQQEKLDALQQISRLYQEMNQAIDRCQIQKFLVRWAEKEAAQTEIDQRELERTECKENLANVNEQREELERQIEQKETRRSELELACRQSNVFQEEERLLNTEKALRDEQKKLEQGLQNLEVEIKREARHLQRFCEEIQELEPEELLIPVQEAANTAQKAYVDADIFPNNASNVSVANYEYIDCVEILRNNANESAAFLRKKAEEKYGFYSVKSGYSFSDLVSEYEYLTKNALNDLYAYVINHKLVRDYQWVSEEPPAMTSFLSVWSFLNASTR